MMWCGTGPFTIFSRTTTSMWHLWVKRTSIIWVSFRKLWVVTPTIEVHLSSPLVIGSPCWSESLSILSRRRRSRGVRFCTLINMYTSGHTTQSGREPTVGVSFKECWTVPIHLDLFFLNNVFINFSYKFLEFLLFLFKHCLVFDLKRFVKIGDLLV